MKGTDKPKSRHASYLQLAQGYCLDSGANSLDTLFSGHSWKVEYERSDRDVHGIHRPIRTRLAFSGPHSPSTWARHRTTDRDIACVLGAAYGDLPVYSGAGVTVMVSLQVVWDESHAARSRFDVNRLYYAAKSSATINRAPCGDSYIHRKTRGL